MATGQGGSPDAEWYALEPKIIAIEEGPQRAAKRGRPKAQPLPAEWEGHDTLHLSSGVTLHKETDSNGYLIRFSGKGIDGEVIDSVMVELQRLLERP
ncbi:MAG: ParB family chromosome partitioning protein [Yoonia sp.]